MSECPVCEMAATEVQMAKATMIAQRNEIERMNANLEACQHKLRTLVAENRNISTELARVWADRTYTPEAT
jgi:hypothetical protein